MWDVPVHDSTRAGDVRVAVETAAGCSRQPSHAFGPDPRPAVVAAAEFRDAAEAARPVRDDTAVAVLSASR